MSQQCFTDEPFVSQMLSLDVTPDCFPSSETVPVTAADPGRFRFLAASLAAQSGGVQPVFGHVQLRGAAVPAVGSQLWTPGSRSGPGSGPRPPASEQGLGPGGLSWERRTRTLSALLTQRPRQVERGGSL